MNINVKLVFNFTFFQGFGRGIWLGNVLTAFIFFIANESTELLGYTSAAMGLAMSLVVFPAGILSDKFRRDILLKIAFFIGLIGLIITALANTLFGIIIALVFWGIFQGLIRPSVESLFADSIKSGMRSKLYSWLHVVRQISMSVGPFINIVLFYFLGDTWDLTVLKTVMYVGLVISAVSLIPLLLMNDDKSMGEASDTIYSEEETENNGVKSASKFIPTVLISSNLIIGTGAGMTIRFFTPFFIEEYDLSPIPVNFILGLTFVFTGLSSLWAQKSSMKKGRVKMIIMVQSIATLCLFLIAFYPPIIILAILYIVRGSLMNASQPLSRSIL
ncbi:MAG: MFS transporter, partial [Cyclobacteriaceae bacterium]|nr:MFS transporter [Cyclobacteriaceae bacterium]